MTQKVKSVTAALVLTLAIGASTLVSTIVSAVNPWGACDGNSGPGCDSTTGAESYIGDIINTVLFIAGVLAVIMLIYGGISYTISAGDSGKITKAKNIIMYSVVGLVVAILAYAIVNFIVGRFAGSTGDSEDNPAEAYVLVEESHKV